MKRMMVCLLALFLLIGVLAVPLKVSADYSNDITINNDGSVTPFDAPIVTSDNTTYALIGDVNGSIIVMRDNIIIDGAGYTLRGTGSTNEKGLDLSLRSNVTIGNMQVREFYYGLYLSNSSNISIGKNNVSNNVYGVAFVNSSTNNNVSENVFVNDGLWVISSYGNTVKDNLVNGKPLTYLEGMSNVTVNSNTGQVILVNCDSATVENLDLSYTSCSIELVNTSNSKIADNNIMNSQSGIGLWSSLNNQIYGNNITGNSIGGIGLGSSSTNNTISGNIVAEDPIGLEFVESPNNTISMNNITECISYAIELLQSSNTVVSKNNVENSTYGIVLSDSSSNTVRENNILDNKNGLLIYNSSNNIVYHNNLLNNNQTLTVQVSPPNFFDNGLEGNYWSDYNGTDNNQDGIGDTPYIIDVNNTDHYPLMGTFQSFNVYDSWTRQYELETVISNSTIESVVLVFAINSFGPIPFYLHLSGFTGQEGTTDFCRITFPNIMMNSSSYPVWEENLEGNSSQISSRILTSNGTHTTLYFTYAHPMPDSTIDVFPEFPSILILPLFFITTLLAVIFYRKRLTKCL